MEQVVLCQKYYRGKYVRFVLTLEEFCEEYGEPESINKRNFYCTITEIGSPDWQVFFWDVEPVDGSCVVFDPYLCKSLRKQVEEAILW